jgi:glycosyltransferase involved in cell wall biosynthesis
LGTPADVFSSVDLDTLPAMRLAAWLRGKSLVYDAHEIFTEVPELLDRPFKQWVWRQLERFLIPGIRHAYTVNQSLAQWYAARYAIQMQVVRNMPFAKAKVQPQAATPHFILYQGALNHGRGIEALLESLALLPELQLVIAGRGDLDVALRQKCSELGLNDRVRFTGQLDPESLQQLTEQAWLGVNLLESHALNYYYSLANKFFDYVQAGIPQLCMNFPEYALLNGRYQVALLCDDLQPEKMAEQIKELLQSPEIYRQLAKNCQQAAVEWIWENEKVILLRLYASI